MTEKHLPRRVGNAQIMTSLINAKKRTVTIVKRSRMKTINEVIKANECCDHGDLDSKCEDCPYSGIGACCAERETDSLHYLKEYQATQMAYIKMMADLKDNPPFTWSELKQMKDKPMWIDAESLPVGLSPYWKDRYIIKSFSNDEFMYCNDGFEWAKENARMIIGKPTERSMSNV